MGSEVWSPSIYFSSFYKFENVLVLEFFAPHIPSSFWINHLVVSWSIINFEPPDKYPLLVFAFICYHLQMESACVSIHEALKSVIDYQTHFRLREAQGRSRAEDLNTRVAFWSIGEAIILLVVSISQVVLLRSFFSDKKTTTTRVGS